MSHRNPRIKSNKTPPLPCRNRNQNFCVFAEFWRWIVSRPTRSNMSIIVTEYVSGLFDLDLRCCTLHTQICGAEPFTPRFVVLHRFCNADETSKMSATAEMPQATNVIDRLSYDGFCATHFVGGWVSSFLGFVTKQSAVQPSISNPMFRGPNPTRVGQGAFSCRKKKLGFGSLLTERCSA